jgi:hypothetical protein
MMVNLLFLIAQGGLFGYVAGLAFPGFPPEFWFSVVGNSTLLVLYGLLYKNNI